MTTRGTILTMPYRRPAARPDCTRISPVIATCAACGRVIREVHLPRGTKRGYCAACCPACNSEPPTGGGHAAAAAGEGVQYHPAPDEAISGPEIRR